MNNSLLKSKKDIGICNMNIGHTYLKKIMASLYNIMKKIKMKCYKDRNLNYKKTIHLVFEEDTI